jgi:hypothetical protein
MSGPSGWPQVMAKAPLSHPQSPITNTIKVSRSKDRSMIQEDKTPQ